MVLVVVVRFFNIAVLESAGDLKQAFTKPEVRSSLGDLDTVASPHLFKKVAVPGICVDLRTSHHRTIGDLLCYNFRSLLKRYFQVFLDKIFYWPLVQLRE